MDKVLRVCPEAFFFWILNVVEQNRTQTAFLQVLRHFDLVLTLTPTPTPTLTLTQTLTPTLTPTRTLNPKPKPNP